MAALWGECAPPLGRAIAFEITKLVIPAKAGIQGTQGVDFPGTGKRFWHWPDVIWRNSVHWIPAFAGMTGTGKADSIKSRLHCREIVNSNAMALGMVGNRSTRPTPVYTDRSKAVLLRGGTKLVPPLFRGRRQSERDTEISGGRVMSRRRIP